MRTIVATLVVGALCALAACAHGMAGSAVRHCTTAMGYERGTSEYVACMQPFMDEARQIDRANMQAGLVVLSGLLQGYGEAVPSGEGPTRRALFVCPDGGYTTSGRCYRTPIGSYVGGPPRIAPDGSYVGGSGAIIMCPNGRYVSGTRCYLAPDGTYVGG